MEDVKKYAKTLDEIEGEMMFGGELPESLADSDEDHNIFDDFDAANDETFGGGLDNIAENAEIETYATQTERLRLDDPVWKNPSSSDISAPDASQIPIPFPFFDHAEPNNKSSFEAESPFFAKSSIWNNGNDNSYNIWGTGFGIGTSDPQVSLDIDYSLLRNDVLPIETKKETKTSHIPSMPSAALKLEDFEKQLSGTTQSLEEALKGLRLESFTVAPEPEASQDQIILPPTSQTVPETSAALPTLPVTGAVSLEELERKMVQESQPNRQRQGPQQPSPIPDRFAHPPPGFPPNMPPRMMNQMSPIIPPPVGMPGMPIMPPMGFPPMGPMMPPPNMPLPKLPPLNPQFLPMIPIWLNLILHNMQLPMGVPPPPPFLYQLLAHYRNPQLVYAMIMQSSIPPNMRPNGPQFGPSQGGLHSPGGPGGPGGPGSHMGHAGRFQRKPVGMPSTRTIYDLALDSYAGYMSYKEREWLIRIQFVQCKGSGDPFVDDYYYVMWKDKQVAEGWTPEVKPIEQAPKEKKVESQKDYQERIRRMNYREMQKERARERDKERKKERQERIKRGEEKKPRQTLSDKFATSLGLPTKSSTQNPRHVLDMKQQVESIEHSQAKKMTDEERKIAVAKKLRTMLLRLEGALCLLIEIDELRKPKVSEKSQFKGLSSDEKEQAIDQRTSLIIDELFGEDLPKLMQMSKGRAVITRTLKVVGPKDQARIVLALMTAGGLISKKYFAEIILDILPVIYIKISNLHPDQFKYLVGALNLDNLKKQLVDNNVFVRDMMLTLYFVSDKNNQTLLEWSKATKFTSLKMPSNAPLNHWRKALSAISDSEILEFADTIKYSGIVDSTDVATLIEQSL